MPQGLILMQSSTCSKNTFNEEIGSEMTFVFEHSHELGTSGDMFHTYPNTGNFFIGLFFFFGKLLSLCFLSGLYYLHPFRSISLISGILIEGARNRKRIHRVSHLFVMCFAGNGLTDKENQTGCSNDNGILYRMIYAEWVKYGMQKVYNGIIFERDKKKHTVRIYIIK